MAFEFDANTAQPVGPQGFDPSTAQPAKPRGAIGEIANQLYAGAVADLPKMGGQALQYMSEPGRPLYELGKRVATSADERGKQPDLQPDEANHNFVTNALAAGARMIPQSVVPAAAVGGAIAALPFEVPAALALGGAAAIGSLPTAFSQGQQTLDKAKEAGIPDDVALTAARKTAAIEGLGETAGTYFGGKLFGIGGKSIASVADRALGRAAAPAAEGALAEATGKSVLKPFLKQLPETAAVETGTEMGQNAGEAYVEQQAGIDNQSPVEAAQQAIAPTLGMTALLAPFGLAGRGMQARANARRAGVLMSGEADPAQRLAAAQGIQHEIADVDPEAAANFGAHAARAVQSGQDLDIGTHLFKAPEDVAPAPPAGPMTRAVALLPAPVVHVDAQGNARRDGEAAPQSQDEPAANVVGRAPFDLPQQPAPLALPAPRIEVNSQGVARAPGQMPAAPAPGPRETGAMGLGRNSEIDGAPIVNTDASAHQAATSPLNERAQPTEAQIEAGNYRKGHARIGGLDISIENPQGSTRSGTDANGTPWSTTMEHHYGYIKGTTGNDGDHVDVFVKPGTTAEHEGPVFVVDQMDPATGKWDEHKAIVGAADRGDAEAMYRSNYAPDWKGMGPVTEMSTPEFRKWVRDGQKNEPLAAPQSAPAEAASVPATGSEGVGAAAAGNAAPGISGVRTNATTPALSEATKGAPDATRPAEAAAVPAGSAAPGQRGIDTPEPAALRDEAPSAAGGAASAPAGQGEVIGPQYRTRTQAGAALKQAGKGFEVAALREGGFTLRKVEKEAAAPAGPKPLSVGIMPGDTMLVTVKDGVVHLGAEPAVNFDTGEPVKVAAGASEAQVRQALKDAGALSRRQKFFGGEAAAAPAQSARQAPQEAKTATPAAPRYGVDGTALEEGGKPFGGRREAEKFRRDHNPQGKVVQVEGGFAIRDVTDAEMAARTASGKRLQGVLRGKSYDANPMLTFLANHGLYHEDGKQHSMKSEFSPDAQINVRGYGNIFRADGKQTDLLAEQAAEEGYIKNVDAVDELEDLIRKAIRGTRVVPIYAEGVAQAEHERDLARYKDLHDLTADDLDAEGYDRANPQLQENVRGLIALADREGIDVESLLEDVARKNENASSDEYHTAAIPAIEAALAAAEETRAQDRGGAPVAPGAQSQSESRAEAEGLTAPTREDILAQQDRAANAPSADKKAAIDREAAGQTLTQQTAPEQRKDTSGDMFAKAYDESLAVFREASKKFNSIRQEYRDRKIGDEAFLAARATFEKAKEVADAAEAQFIADTNRAEAKRKGAGKPKADDGTRPMFSRRTEPFYSALAREVGAINAKAQPAMGWQSQIQGLVKAGKVKADEVEWTGLTDWLKLQSGKVTKEQVQDYLAHNGVQVHEVTKGGGNAIKELDRLNVEADALGYTFDRDRFENGDEYVGRDVFFTRRSDGAVFDFSNRTGELQRADGQANKTPAPDALRAIAQSIHDLTDGEQSGDGPEGTRYSQYTLPGGTNYREVLLTLPQKTQPKVALKDWRAERFGEATGADYDGWNVRGTMPDGQTFRSEIGLEDAATADEAIVAAQRVAGIHEMTDEGPAVNYRSGHWDEPNILAHIRLNDRTDATGAKTLFVEEIQSDWAQAGRKQGFQRPLTADEERDRNVVDRTVALVRQVNKIIASNDDLGFSSTNEARHALFAHDDWADRWEVGPEEAKTINEWRESAKQAHALGPNTAPGSTAPPNAPFVGKTDAWLTLALKRIVKMAADEGYDKIAFISGAQSADRYDLSKQISRVSYSDAGVLRAYDMDGKNVINQKLGSDKELPDLVGKEVAQRLVDAPKKDVRIDGVDFKARELSGLDLKVGGEGMKAFYDKIVPAAANKLLAKIGGEKLGEVRFDPLPDIKGNGWESTETPGQQTSAPRAQPGFDITPAMRDAAGEGLPLFRRTDTAGAMLRVPEIRNALAAPLAALKVPYELHSNTAELSKSTGYSDIPSGVKGAYYAGKLHLVAEGIHSALEAEETFWHEVQHAGLDAMYGIGSKPYENALRAIAMQNANVREAAKEWMAKFGREDLQARIDGGMNPEAALRRVKLQAIDEALAELSGRNATIKGMPQFIARVQDFLRSVGLVRLANYLEGKTNAQALSMILAARSAVMHDEQRAPVGRMQPAFSAQEKDTTTEPSFSRAANQTAMHDAMGMASDLFRVNVPGKLNWWHKTVGTMQNLALRSPGFKRVYDSVQSFINDVSFYATEAADLAPKLLPKLETWRDITKSPISPQDNKAIQKPVFEGTLNWRREEDGSVVAEADPHKAGLVWTDAELKDRYGLNQAQIGLYREMRATVDKSMGNLAISDMLRFAGRDADPIRDAVMESKSVGAAAETLATYLRSLAREDAARRAVLNDTADKVEEKGMRARDLMLRGYAPLSRFGHYTMEATLKTGERYFGMFETPSERRKMKGQLTAAGARIESEGTMSQQAYKIFAGVSPETVELFGGMLGLESQGNTESAQAFQAFLKVARSNRSAVKRLIERQGIAGYNEDVGRVLAGFVYSNARQTSSNLNMGDMTKSLMELKDGEGKQNGELMDTAVNLVEYIKNPIEEAQKLRGLLFAQYIGGSVASAIVNVTQPLTMTLPWLSQYGGATHAARQLAQATKDSLARQTGDAALDAALHHAEENGIVSPQEVHQLMKQAQGLGALRPGSGTAFGNAAAKAGNTLAKIELAWGKLFSAAEQFNRRVTFIAAWRTATERGMADPAGFAAQAIAETQGVYNKGNKPAWARGAVGSTLFTFKQYSIAYVEMLHRMWTTGGPEGKRAALLGVGILFALSGVSGLPGSDDLDDVISGFLQSLGYNFDSKGARKAFLADIVGDGGADFLERGLSGLPGVPIDVSGRLGLGNLIPGTGLLTKKQDHAKDVAEIAGPAGDLATRVFTAAGKVLHGDVPGALNSLSPKASQNLVQAYDMANMGMYRDQGGKKVLDTDGYDAFAKAVGFQPNDVKKVQDATMEVQRRVSLNKMRESEIADQWAQGVFEHDAGKVQSAKEAVATWNADNPESPIRINYMTQVLKRVKSMQEDKVTRIAKTAPKEIRASVRAELEAAR